MNLFTLFTLFTPALPALPATPHRLETHPEASSLLFATATQRARLAALNALAVAPLSDSKGPSFSSSSSSYLSSETVTGAGGAGEAGGAVASICPPVGERRLDAAGRPAGVRTAAVLGREAAASAAAIVVAVAAAAASAEEEAENEAEKNDKKKWAGVHGRFAAVRGGGVAVAEVAVVTRSGVSGVVEALTSAGRFEEAADVVLKGLDHQVRE